MMKILLYFPIIFVLVFPIYSNGQSINNSNGYKAMEDYLSKHGAPLYKDLGTTEFLNELYGYSFFSNEMIELTWSPSENDYIKTNENDYTSNFRFTQNSLSVQIGNGKWTTNQLNFYEFDPSEQQYRFTWGENEVLLITKDKSTFAIGYNFDKARFKNLKIFRMVKKKYQS